MIPGFASVYIDKDNFKHLYFFKGIDDDDKPIYYNIDLSNYSLKYDKVINSDESIDYKFYDKSIIKITCKLFKLNEDIDILELNYKD